MHSPTCMTCRLGGYKDAERPPGMHHSGSTEQSWKPSVTAGACGN